MREIKRQIKSKQNMMQITKAMEMVAAAKLKRSQDAALASRPYANKIKEVISSIASGAGSDVKHPLLVTRPIKKTAYLVISSDRGLAGGYNVNVFRKAVNQIRENHKSADEYAIFVIGRKGRDFFRKRNYPVVEEVIGLSDSPTFSDVKPIAAAAVQGFVDGTYDELNIIYNEFHNAISQTPVVKRLLPLAGDQLSTGNKANYEYEPSAEEVLNVLLPKYAETLVYSALLEGKASEFGARMTAMGNATKNAKKMIGTLTLSYNRARQAAITQEISEIVGGANALQ